MIKIRNEKLIKSLGNRVTVLRESQRLSKTRLASLAGISPRQLLYIEQGQTNATVSTLFAISTALGITIYELMNYSPFNKL